MHRFYVNPERIDSSTISLPALEAKHAYRVLRLRKGDEVIVFDGDGTEYRGAIVSLSAQQGSIGIKSRTRYQPPALQITLAAAIPKQSRFDDIVDSATQLGVQNLIPLITERTIVKFAAGEAAVKQQRWQKIAVEAAKQCGGVYIPRVSAAEMFPSAVERAGCFDLALIPALAPGAVGLKEILRTVSSPKKIIVFIGPEGDFSPDEIITAKNNNCHVVSLGARVLRCATAANMVLSVLRYEWEN